VKGEGREDSLSSCLLVEGDEWGGMVRCLTEGDKNLLEKTRGDHKKKRGEIGERALKKKGRLQKSGSCAQNKKGGLGGKVPL